MCFLTWLCFLTNSPTTNNKTDNTTTNNNNNNLNIFKSKNKDAHLDKIEMYASTALRNHSSSSNVATNKQSCLLDYKLEIHNDTPHAPMFAVPMM